MRLIETNLNEYIKPNYIIITGDGKTELRLLRGLSRKLDRQKPIIFFPFSTHGRKTGLSALDAVQTYATRYRINSIIYIVDGDTFEDKPVDKEIKNYLTSKGFGEINISSINQALLINCKYGDKEIILYCIISGPEIFIEQEVARLLKLKYINEFNISENITISSKQQFKREINQFIKRKRINLEDLIGKTAEGKIREAFPNFYAVFKNIEDKFK